MRIVIVTEKETSLQLQFLTTKTQLNLTQHNQQDKF